MVAAMSRGSGIHHGPRALPEDGIYRDTGCNLAPACLSCPFEVCRYDTHQSAAPRGVAQQRMAMRERDFRILRRRGVPVDAIAGWYGVTRRTVFRLTADASAVGSPHGRQAVEEAIARAGYALGGSNAIPDWLRKDHGDV